MDDGEQLRIIGVSGQWLKKWTSGETLWYLCFRNTASDLAGWSQFSLKTTRVHQCATKGEPPPLV